MDVRWSGNIALSFKPVFHLFLKMIERHAVAYLYHAIRDWEGVIKNAFVREAAHGEAVQPLERTGRQSAVLLVLDLYLSGKHGVWYSCKAHRLRLGVDFPVLIYRIKTLILPARRYVCFFYTSFLWA